MHQRVLSISTALVFLSCGLQASAEAVTFFFLLFPTEFGGLGMDALEAGNLALICTVVIVILSTRRQLRRMARLPTRAPLRAFRIGMGAEAFAFVLFPIFPRIFGTGGGFLPYFFNVVGLVALVLTSTLSRAASAVLHRIASSSYSKLASDDGLDGPSLTFCGFDLRNYLNGGGFTATVTALGEVRSCEERRRRVGCIYIYIYIYLTQIIFTLASAVTVFRCCLRLLRLLPLCQGQHH